MNLKPISDLIVVLPAPPDDRCGSLVLPPGLSDRGGEDDSPLEEGVVVAVGPGRRNEKTGERGAMYTRPGDRVAYPHHKSVPEYREGAERYLVMHEPGVFAVLNEFWGELERQLLQLAADSIDNWIAVDFPEVLSTQNGSGDPAEAATTSSQNAALPQEN
jgi:co-chaperonin GroES (HSP10)